MDHKFENNYAKYFAAGYLTGIKDISKDKLKGACVLIEGNIPVASGVSSSSALCVCSSMAIHYFLAGP